MEITRKLVVAICLAVGAILLYFGTSVKHYGFEILAIGVITFGVILAIFWNDLFKAKEKECQPLKEEKINV